MQPELTEYGIFRPKINGTCDTQKRDVGYSETGCGILRNGMRDIHKRDVGYSQTGCGILTNGIRDTWKRDVGRDTQKPQFEAHYPRAQVTRVAWVRG